MTYIAIYNGWSSNLRLSSYIWWENERTEKVHWMIPKVEEFVKVF
jgi:hypothetical protein